MPAKSGAASQTHATTPSCGILGGLHHAGLFRHGRLQHRQESRLTRLQTKMSEIGLSSRKYTFSKCIRLHWAKKALNRCMSRQKGIESLKRLGVFPKFVRKFIRAVRVLGVGPGSWEKSKVWFLMLKTFSGRGTFRYFFLPLPRCREFHEFPDIVYCLYELLYGLKWAVESPSMSCVFPTSCGRRSGS